MKLNVTPAPEKLEHELQFDIKRAQRHQITLNGYPASFQFSTPKGAHMFIFAHTNATRPSLRLAVEEGYRTYDVTSHNVILCPSNWFEDQHDFNARF